MFTPLNPVGLIITLSIATMNEVKVNRESCPLHKRLDDHYAKVADYRDSIGYPANLALEYLQPLQRFLLLPFNNIGAPVPATIGRVSVLSTTDYETEVIRFIARLYDLKDEEDYHGYMTSGGTEANLHALSVARDTYPEGILYFSASSHYSIAKSARLLALPYRIINVDENGEMNYQDLALQIRQDKPDAVILSLNIGSTMKGAIDRVDEVVSILHKNDIKRFHIHCDAALLGMMLPFLPDSPCPSFRQAIHSLAISGHKFIGCPFPCGIVLTRTLPVSPYIDYVQARDTTLSGSRNGHAPLLLWYAIMTRGPAGFAEEVKVCLNNAHYLQERLAALHYPGYRGTYSNIVWFAKPDDSVTRKWDLAVEGSLAHVVVMQHVDQQRIDRFVEDMEENIKNTSVQSVSSSL